MPWKNTQHLIKVLWQKKSNNHSSSNCQKHDYDFTLFTVNQVCYMLFRKHGRHFIKAYPIRGPDYVSNTVIPSRDGMLVHILRPALPAGSPSKAKWKWGVIRDLVNQKIFREWREEQSRGSSLFPRNWGSRKHCFEGIPISEILRTQHTRKSKLGIRL